MKMNPVVHFEMGYNDKSRMVDFYTKTFGWQAKEMGPEMGNYVVVQTGETDDKGMLKEPGRINGGFYKKTDSPLSHAPSLVIAVDDIKSAMKSVESAGGKILGSMTESGEQTMEPQDIPGVGLWISAMDTEENRFSILQPKPMMDVHP